MILGCVFDVGLHYTFAYILEDHFRLLKDILGQLGITHRWFLWTIAKFQAQEIVRKMSVENSTRFAPHTCMVGRAMIQDSNVGILVPRWFLVFCFNFKCFPQ